MFILALPHIGLAFHRSFALAAQLLSTFCLQCQVKEKSELAHDHRTNSKSVERVTTYEFCLSQILM